jgi:hypothetical protein
MFLATGKLPQPISIEKSNEIMKINDQEIVEPPLKID